MNNLKFFFDKDKDSNKLVWISQLVIKNSSNIMKQCEIEKSSTYSLAQFLSLTLCYISDTISISTGESKGSHWRVLEIFLNAHGWSQAVGVQTADRILGSIFFFLSRKGTLSLNNFPTMLQLLSLCSLMKVTLQDYVRLLI